MRFLPLAGASSRLRAIRSTMVGACGRPGTVEGPATRRGEDGPGAIRRALSGGDHADGRGGRSERRRPRTGAGVQHAGRRPGILAGRRHGGERPPRRRGEHARRLPRRGSDGRAGGEHHARGHAHDPPLRAPGRARRPGRRRRHLLRASPLLLPLRRRDRRALPGRGRRRRAAPVHLQPAGHDGRGDHPRPDAQDPGRGAAAGRPQALLGEPAGGPRLRPHGPALLHRQQHVHAAGHDHRRRGLRRRTAADGPVHLAGDPRRLPQGRGPPGGGRPAPGPGRGRGRLRPGGGSLHRLDQGGHESQAGGRLRGPEAAGEAADR